MLINMKKYIFKRLIISIATLFVILFVLKGSSLINLAPKSVLSMMGYTVEKNHDPGENVRHQILALIVDNNILKKSEVISYLDFFINMRDNRPVYQDAIAKWAADRQFISDYEKGKYKTFGVKSIRRQH